MTDLTNDELDDLLGRGEGDPDMHGYPGLRQVGDQPKVKRSREANEPRDYGDNDPSDPEQNWGEDNDV